MSDAENAPAPRDRQESLPVVRDAAFGVVPIFAPAEAAELSRDRYQFLLIQHHAGHWAFPKGHADPGESPLETACREFVEETGIERYELLDAPSFEESYAFVKGGKYVEKVVTYFLARVTEKTVRMQAEEIQNFAWEPYETAIDRITYEANRTVLRSVWEYLADRPIAAKD